MSHCCGNGNCHQTRRSGRLSAAITLLRRWLGLVVILLVIAVAWVWFTFGPGKAFNQDTSAATSPTTGSVEGPRIQFDETKFDFGQVALEQVVEHTFTYRNVGTKALVLEQDVLVTVDEGC